MKTSRKIIKYFPSFSFEWLPGRGGCKFSQFTLIRVNILKINDFTASLLLTAARAARATPSSQLVQPRTKIIAFILFNVL